MQQQHGARVKGVNLNAAARFWLKEVNPPMQCNSKASSQEHVVLWPKTMCHGHRTCSMAMEHVLGP